jgi:predicted O-methyltransferase YrrM
MREPYSAVTDEYSLWSCNDIDSTETEVIELLGSLVRAAKPKVCVEVGAHIGLSSVEIGTALEQNGRGELHCFEVIPESARAAAQRTAGLPVTVHRMADVEYDPASLTGLVDFLFVDGDLDNRDASLLHWQPWLSGNHIIAVHDSVKREQVRESLDAVPQLERIDIVTPRGLTLMKVALPGPAAG